MVAPLEKIKQRGYWRITIRPATHLPKRIAKLTDLRAIIDENTVSFRGWSFPHVGKRAIEGKEPVEIYDGYIEGSSSWEAFIESFRFYQSGQFIDYRAFADDWQEERKQLSRDTNDPPGSRFSVGEAVYQLTEIYEFAARLSKSPAGDDRMECEVRIENLKGRRLTVDGRWMPFIADHIAAASQFERKDMLARPDLLGRASELAIDVAMDLFQLFGWDADRRNLKSFQEEMRR
jgi:hypothetical protein